ncbi:MAG: amidohydrolase family protein [Defluviitaleaceae bacterium]|nr:amidohydrolase family protein [Defluviitaleaceae bacterium]
MSSIHELAKAGKPLTGLEVIDAHAHIGNVNIFNNPRNMAEDMIANMDALGVASACISALAAIQGDYKRGNDITIDAVTRYPGRFHGFVVINPSYTDDIVHELERCLKVDDMRGIKIHPAGHGFMPDHKYYNAVYETADKYSLPVLIHTWGSMDVAAVGNIAPRYPNANLIMGHSGADSRGMEAAIDLVNKYDNVYGDLAISLAYEGNVEWFVKEIGAEKVLYGTDMPFFSPSPNLGRVAMADISDAEKKNVLGLNIKKLLRV